jgi:antitoxin (DNA-binding transcriptional repressor) of toxin-antitoxin stability system
MVVTKEIGNGQLADLVKQLQAGNEIVLTQGDKPVARLVSAQETVAKNGTALHVRSFKGHQVLTPVISQEELAEEMLKPR